MYIPRSWFQAKSEVEHEREKRRLIAWGWGDDEGAARAMAVRRLARLVECFQRGEPRGGDYDYATRPPREEIVQALGAEAVLTRNAYGAIVLNAERLLFLDVDLPDPPGALGRLFGKRDTSEDAVAKLRLALRVAAPAVSFRLYRTASGLRALATDREFDPLAAETQALMERTGTDENFARLCRTQKSFRARLTPKPWRCKGGTRPPNFHPREDERARKLFADWLREYERAIEPYATCRFLETVGPGAIAPHAKALVELHDAATRCTEPLPLA